MPELRPSTTHSLSFAAVIARLSQQEAVDGLIVVGSAAQGAMTPASDYDLVVVLAQMPLPLHVGVTSIDGRFTDLLFHTTAQVEQFLAATEPLDFADWTGRLVGWLETGEVLFDRSGRLQEAQMKAQSGSWVRIAKAGDAFKAWNGVNYNLQVVRRYFLSDDPLYLETADLRMALYGPTDLFFNYFRSRSLRWTGEKGAIRYLRQHDPEYLSLFQRFVGETDRTQKFRLYEQLAERTVAPVGALWHEGEVVMIPDVDVVTPDVETKALDFWESLVGTAPAE